MKKAYILLILSSVFWGISFIMTKELFLTESNLTVTILITLRLAVATAVFIPILAFTHRLQPLRKAPTGRMRLLRGDLKWFLLLALAEPFLYNLCETSGVQLVSGSLSSVIVATIPLFVPFGMAAVYRERLRLPMLVGIALSVIGVGIMLVGGEPVKGQIRGLAFLAGAVVIAVIYTLILVKIVDHYHPAVITAYQNLIGLVYYLPLMLLVDASHIPFLSFSPKMLGLILALGVLCSTLAYIFYNYGVRRLGASAACIFNNTIPIFSMIAAIAIGQESFNWAKFIGMCIVIGGVIISQRP